MNNGFILFYDSGVGGLSTLSKARKILGKEHFLYFADNKNCPLGNKSDEEIYKIVCESLKSLLKRFNIKLIVFACNTITACCIERLRAEFAPIIVGIEPAIMPASRASKTNNIMVIATNATIRQERYKKLVKKTKAKVISYPLKDLAEEIENAAIKYQPINLKKYTEKIKEIKKLCNIDCLVLGCTHYCLVKKELESLTGLRCFDGNEGVAKQIYKILKQNSLFCGEDYGGEVRFIFSLEGNEWAKSGDFIAQKYKNLLNKL